MGDTEWKESKVDEKFIEAQLRALGCTSKVDPFIIPVNAVYKNYVEYWRKYKKPPQQRYISDKLGISPSRVSDHCRTLERSGRMIKTPKGWIPVVTKEGRRCAK